MPGVRAVVKVSDAAVAVVADTWWRAKTALEALPIVWNEGPGAAANDATIAEHLREGLTAAVTNGERSNGDALKAIAGAAKTVEAVYGTPFLAHACMEMMNCTARVSADSAEVWVATQNAEASLAALSAASGLPLGKCEVHKHDLGGGFGRRGGTQDYVHEAVAIAKRFPDTPVKLIWSREEDLAHDFFRPISQCRLTAGLDAAGNLVGLHIRVSGQSINASLNPTAIKDGKDMRQLQGYWEQPGEAQLGYTVPNLLIEYAMRNTHVPVGPWRGVNTNQNGVYLECFIDEAARAAGKDPLEFRRALLGNHPKHRGVLDAAAEKGGWGTPLPAGVHRGIAQFMGYGSYSAAVAEVSVSDAGKLKVHRLVLALNCGHAVNPGQIAAQVEGSVAYGLSATLYGECPVDKGRMTSPQLRLLRDPQDCRDAEGRDGDRADARFLGRRRRADDLRRRAGRPQRHPRRDRQAGAHAALEERQAGVGGGAQRLPGLFRQLELLQHGGAAVDEAAEVARRTRPARPRPGRCRAASGRSAPRACAIARFADSTASRADPAPSPSGATSANQFS